MPMLKVLFIAWVIIVMILAVDHINKQGTKSLSVVENIINYNITCFLDDILWCALIVTIVSPTVFVVKLIVC